MSIEKTYAHLRNLTIRSEFFHLKKNKVYYWILDLPQTVNNTHSLIIKAISDFFFIFFEIRIFIDNINVKLFLRLDLVNYRVISYVSLPNSINFKLIALIYLKMRSENHWRVMIGGWDKKNIHWMRFKWQQRNSKPYNEFSMKLSHFSMVIILTIR